MVAARHLELQVLLYIFGMEGVYTPYFSQRVRIYMIPKELRFTLMQKSAKESVSV